ncbi:hypothetical protein BJ138DRAFT_1153468 [Hygrophoropsis aurantiaca]|uniref:Uncharacterized protein n=1 Tax=Hygrophoropsis aurantiaca TaxID=72124 RepID=A0ACB8AAX0_9AGAM|nr:hypothetical protein BJ138DRAFT_1153468 [Hygrophoropsis aurantiaca]
MTDYINFQDSPRDIRIDPNYAPRSPSDYRDYQPEPRRQSQTRIRDVTWISHQPSSAHTPQTPRWIPPPQPIPIPTPPADHVHNTISRPQTESDWLDEFMTVTAGGEIEGERHMHEFQEDGMVHPEMGYGFSEERKGESRNFVGGFVNGLRRLPKIMSKGRLRDRKNPRQHTTNTIDLDRDPLPRYQSNDQLNFEQPLSDVQYVEGMDMPSVEIAPEHPVSPRIPMNGPANGNGNTNPSTPGDMRRERLTLSAVHEHSYEQHDNNPGSSSSALRTPHHTFHPSAEAIRSPVLASPKPGSDFAKMESPIRAPSDTSIGTQFVRVQRFVRELNELPWVSSRVAVEYKPGESSRAKYRRQRDSKPSASWYNTRHDRSLDLLAGPPSARVLPHYYHHQQYPGYVPGSSANLLYQYPHGNRSHTPSGESPPSQQGSTDSHGNPLYPYGYPAAYVAQPLFMYPSGIPPPGVSSPENGANPPEMHQARPVYLLTTSPTTLLSPPQGRYSPLRMPQ